jgi:carboxyl-terminal processing protease
MNVSVAKRVLAATIALTASGILIGGGADATLQAQSEIPPRCTLPPSNPPSTPPQMQPTTLRTIGQAFFCIIDNYWRGPMLDSRSLLVPAFVGLTQELQRRGVDQVQATMPALTGRNERDWAAFSSVYAEIEAHLPQDASVRQAVAEASLQGMVKGLNDNHASWQRGMTPNLSGISLSGFRGVVDLDPAATAPLFITDVNGPVESLGIRRGDEVLAVNRVPPFINGMLSESVVKWITELARGSAVELMLRRPATNETLTVNLTPTTPQPPRPEPDATVVGGNIAYAKLQGFDVQSVDRVLAAVRALRAGNGLRGFILDLRGNTGGDPDAVARLLGAFAHDRVTGYSCDAREQCTPNHTDDSVDLLNLRLVVLTDRKCASACDHFASAVKDLQLGTLVGTRTAGIVSGIAGHWILEDGSSIQLPIGSGLAANGEIINEIGVSPHYYAPTTSTDLSAGRDTALAEAITLLR